GAIGGGRVPGDRHQHHLRLLGRVRQPVDPRTHRGRTIGVERVRAHGPKVGTMIRCMRRALPLIVAHQSELRACRRCPEMIGPVVVGAAVKAEILLVGQAPGDKEPALGRPFAWTAGKTLFKWFAELGIDEATFRERVYMAATCRCFPGKQPRGGDRVPSETEVANCRPWLEREIELLEPEL